MFRFLNIIISSFKMALEELRSNKLRTFLSLLGITFGIFCIISVLATIASMKIAIKDGLNSLGSKSIFIDKWEWRDDDNYPWWKYIKRPVPKYEELEEIRQRVPIIANASYMISDQSSVEFGDDMLSNINYYGVTEEFSNIEHFEVSLGRYLQQTDFTRSTNSIVVGFNIADKMFGKAEKALGQTVRLKNNKPALIIGVIAKQGQGMMNMWDYDNSIIMTPGFLKQMTVEKNANPKILVQGKSNVSIPALKEELTGAMRSLHKLKPRQEDDYALNDIESFSKFMDSIFININIGGWAIAGLSLIVGMFGVANIMFVTVKERTSQIGLKKALGAKRSTIMAEFLLESAFLCVIGGLIGLIAVYILVAIFTILFPFKVTIPPDVIAIAVSICLTVGVLAGIIPAFVAARMDPVKAIRST
ncbi:MAG: ABC transporter permease [Chitinophagales bacterium]